MHTTSNRSRFHIDITSIRRRPIFDEFPHHLRVLYWCNFAGRNIHVFFTYFFNVISIVEKLKLFPRTFFDVIALVKKLTLFSLTLFQVILMVKKSTLFASTFFDETSTGKNSTLFLVKLQANESIWGGFPLLVTLKNWLLQDFSP